MPQDSQRGPGSVARFRGVLRIYFDLLKFEFYFFVHRVLDRVTEACGVCVWGSGSLAAAALRAALQHGHAALRIQRARAVRRTVRLADARGIVLHHGECTH